MGKKKKALYAGTFDPFTNGHYDIVKRALPLFDELTIVVAVPPMKKPFLPADKRVGMIKEVFQDEPTIKVESWAGLIVDFAREKKIGSIIRGLRPTGDFDNEFQMAAMNRKLLSTTDTVFFMTDERTYFISSSLVKEIYSHGGDITPFVPKIIHDKLVKHVK